MAKIEEETNAVTEQQTQATEQPNLAQLLQRLEDQDQKIQELSEQQ
jgi:heat shock protein HspQ